MSSEPVVVLATHNAHKLTEIRDILTAHIPTLAPSAITSAGELGVGDVVEDGVTFAENALIKARALTAATGLIALADDSGLSVAVLGGAPGIFSARWAGRHGDDAANNALLLAQLADIAPAHRAAAFVCAAAMVTPAGKEIVELGELSGTLLDAPVGAGGFGYDPLIQPDGYQESVAQLSAAEKNRISHRAKAFSALAPHLRAALL